ncbi:LysE family translocator [Halomonas huangheensis]|uniref:Lysine exporter protein LysE/YggA n=1 Tax=Halomonas huangheensis TaxID=1178482 RepID=W1N2R5_9GAMM|nr:LysE family translocator [Halomonas huangheensis]ALM52249.1 lysine transporter LysE [Halomonas huangheensis]ERL49471.1 lysine exporter protein LysE/YggA [Halomonas huangheensis]
MSDLSFVVPVTLFMMSMTLTPGPNNVMLTASGANYGFRRTIPHLLGIIAGCFVLFCSVAMGLGMIFERFPVVQTALKIVGSVYLLYLAWKIATAPPPQFRQEGARPLTFLQAATFQFANPKAWVMGIALMASFLPETGNPWLNALIVAAFAELVAFPCISLWAGFGTAVGRTLKSPTSWRWFNGTMGAMTAACVFLILG